MFSHWVRHCAHPNFCRIGELLAQRAQQAGLSGVHWRRRHGEQFHGKRKALIDSMRDAGLPLI
jgi:large subunit ribosomal protein L18